MLLRRERPGELTAIADVHEAAFGPCPGGCVEARLVTDLRDDGDIIEGLSLVAVDHARIVGHVVCSAATIGTSRCLGLGPLGVLPQWQRQGVGKALMRRVLAAADALGAPAVVLLGSPIFYSRFGFVLAEPMGVSATNPAWAPHLQIRTLETWDPATRGQFRYASAFERVSS